MSQQQQQQQLRQFHGLGFAADKKVFFGQQIFSRTLKRKGKRRGVGDKPPGEYIECILGLGNSNFRIVGSEIRPKSKQCSAKQYWKFRKKEHVGFYEPLEEKFEDKNIVASLLFPPWVERKLETSNSRNCWAWGPPKRREKRRRSRQPFLFSQCCVSPRPRKKKSGNKT